MIGVIVAAIFMVLALLVSFVTREVPYDHIVRCTHCQREGHIHERGWLCIHHVGWRCPLHTPEARIMTAREILDKFFEDIDELTESQQRSVWFILTALRGPDDDPMVAFARKHATTARVRGLVCPKLAKTCMATVNTDGECPKTNSDSFQHFDVHMFQAVRALRRLGYLP